jgi:hypothetical protein
MGRISPAGANREPSMPIDTFKLGKQPTRHDPRTLKLSAYTARLEAPPEARDWTGLVPEDGWGAMLNDRCGCCTIAAPGHLVQAWTANDLGMPVTIPDDAILAAYIEETAADGAAYDPATGWNDNGCILLNVMNRWRQTGIGGHRIGAYAALEPGHATQLMHAVNLFGGAAIGVELPESARGQIERQLPWDIAIDLHGASSLRGSWGGHAVAVLGYSPRWVYVLTWGRLQRATWRWLRAYMSEGYAALSTDWIDEGRTAPNGFDLPTLQQHLARITA